MEAVRASCERDLPACQRARSVFVTLSPGVDDGPVEAPQLSLDILKREPQYPVRKDILRFLGSVLLHDQPLFQPTQRGAVTTLRQQPGPIDGASVFHHPRRRVKHGLKIPTRQKVPEIIGFFGSEKTGVVKQQREQLSLELRWVRAPHSAGIVRLLLGSGGLAPPVAWSQPAA